MTVMFTEFTDSSMSKCRYKPQSQSYVLAYYIYMKVYNDIINNSLQCKIEKNIKFGALAIVLIHNDCLK